MVNVSRTKALFHLMHIFVMEPHKFGEKFTIVEATRHRLGNGSRERNEGRFRAFDRPFDLCQDASQYHASRKGWHERGNVRERISDPDNIVYTRIVGCRKRDGKSCKADTENGSKSPVL